MIVEITSTPIAVSVWKQEKCVLLIGSQTDGVKVWTSLHGNYDSPIAQYTPDSNGDVYIDMTDYVRTYPSVTIINVYSVTDSVQYVLNVTMAGLINPHNVIIPDSAMLQKIGGSGILCPPAMMIEPINSLTTKTEVYGYATGSVTYYDSNGTIGAQNFSELALNIPNTATQIWYNSGAYKQHFLPLRCGVRYCAVRWVSFTGKTRQHTFEVEQSKTTTGGSYSLLPIDNEYIDIKGRVDSFNLHLDGLNAYDLWYYADVLHSSKVEVSFDGVTFDRVQVVSKDITIPDGEAGTKGELDINVNWKRYDAVAM